jgi:adenine deaminase
VLGLPGALEKLLAFQDGHIDGHAPGVTGKWLQAYLAAGPATDHESMTAAEALEKVRSGMHVLIREATAVRNLHAILPAITPGNARRFAFASDDRHPAELLDEGCVDHQIRLAVAAGLDPLTAIQMATLNAAEAFGLTDRGAIAPGRRADLVVTPSLTDFRAAQVFVGGKLVAQAARRWASGRSRSPTKAPCAAASTWTRTLSRSASPPRARASAPSASSRPTGDGGAHYGSQDCLNGFNGFNGKIR